MTLPSIAECCQIFGVKQMSIPKKQILSNTSKFLMLASQNETIADFQSYFTQTYIFKRNVRFLKAFIAILSKNGMILYKQGE